MTSGIHHVTLITRAVPANVDFYMGFLGLRLVKRTAGCEDATQLHLVYGDGSGAPGSLITFLVWEAGAAGRVAEVAFAVPLASIGDWLTRAIAEGIRVEGLMREFGEPVLRLKDPDGITVKLVDADLPAASPWGKAPTRLRSVTIWTETPAGAAAFLARFGYRPGAGRGRVAAPDLGYGCGRYPGCLGLRARHPRHRRGRSRCRPYRRGECRRVGFPRVGRHSGECPRPEILDLAPCPEPGGTLVEVATDAPGFAVDEPEAHQGETLFVPEADPVQAAALRVMLPQFALPARSDTGRAICPSSTASSRRRRRTDRSWWHGTGGGEADLMTVAARIASHATLVRLRGRATEEDHFRWFRRFEPLHFDQDDIRAVAETFAAFIEGAIGGYGFDPSRLRCWRSIRG